MEFASCLKNQTDFVSPLSFLCSFGPCNKLSFTFIQVREIKKGNSFSVQVSYTSSEVGMHTNVFGIVFRTESEDVFVITRNLIGHTESEDMEDLRATGPYVSPKPFITVQEKDLNIIKGVPPEM